MAVSQCTHDVCTLCTYCILLYIIVCLCIMQTSVRYRIMNAHMIYVHCVSIVISGLHVICISFRTKVRITHNTHAHTHTNLC
jgi:hypothetical protein